MDKRFVKAGDTLHLNLEIDVGITHDLILDEHFESDLKRVIADFIRELDQDS